MSTELQSLLDKIQSEGVAKAEAEANRILEEARKKAAAIVAEAETQRTASQARAETEAQQFQQRAEQSVRQAARDAVLGVREAVEQMLRRILLSGVTQALAPDVMKTLVIEAVRAYIATSSGGEHAAVKVPPDQAGALREAVLQEVREAAAKGLEIRPDRDVRAGFRVSLAEGRIEHDFTAEAIQDAMARLLRPALAELLTSEN